MERARRMGRSWKVRGGSGGRGEERWEGKEEGGKGDKVGRGEEGRGGEGREGKGKGRGGEGRGGEGRGGEGRGGEGRGGEGRGGEGRGGEGRGRGGADSRREERRMGTCMCELKVLPTQD